MCFLMMRSWKYMHISVAHGSSFNWTKNTNALFSISLTSIRLEQLKARVCFANNSEATGNMQKCKEEGHLQKPPYQKHKIIISFNKMKIAFKHQMLRYSWSMITKPLRGKKRLLQTKDRVGANFQFISSNITMPLIKYYTHYIIWI
jgi:hypothetical protein